MEPHPYGWFSILPPIAAIILAIATRRVILSLLLGLFVGALISRGGDPFLAIGDTLEIHLWKTLANEGKLRTFSFTLLMGALVGIIHRSGGMQGLVNAISPHANTRKRAQLSTWLLGMLIFFDDYANTLLLGSTLRPLCDRLRVSREKLAYLVDSTAAPVAGLALVSTWVAVEIDYVREGIENMATVSDWNAFQLFLGSIPYRFYVLMSLCFIPILAWLQRDFGPMLNAERRSIRGTGSQTIAANGELDFEHAPVPDGKARWINAVAPILVTLGVVVTLIVITGRRALQQATEPVLWRDVFGSADPSFALQYGALAGIVVAVVMAKTQRILGFEQALGAAGAGARVVLPAIAILWIASSVSRMTGNKSYDGAPSSTAYEYRDYRLYTGEFVQALLVGEAVDQAAGRTAAGRPGWWLPTATFVLSAIVAFCTGTSWGTMGMMLPMTIPLTNAVFQAAGVGLQADDPILLSSVGGVLSGAIFGDHCSPISDTTILSSQASGCDHIAHVWTQMPYALTVALVSILLGTLPIGLGFPVGPLIVLQIATLIFIVFLLGRHAEAVAD